ncbi:transposase [Staphylococcus delphini]|uniref:Transposase n=1 Tax=Staphylococcus delphini TaxID=53344 RepID=A0AAQ0DA64_9STAP|nr:transposase [Staphylococcus delphini]QUM70605.1 transposase [Staphylococcus delphini]
MYRSVSDGEKKYDHSFKKEAIQLVESGRRASEVSRDLDIPIQTLTRWLSVYRKDGEKVLSVAVNAHQRSRQKLI